MTTVNRKPCVVPRIIGRRCQLRKCKLHEPSCCDAPWTAVGDQPLRSLRRAIIQRLSVEGMSRETVLGDLEDLRQGLVEEERFDEEELVLTVMDHVVGWCS